MADLLTILAPLFPFDPAVDSERGHMHLMVIYAVVLLVQFGYAGIIVAKARALAKERASKRLAPWMQQ